MKSQRVMLSALVGLLIIASLAACSGGTIGGTKAPASNSSSSGGGKTFNVTATEFEFKPNKFEATAGQKITFKITNKGTVEHNFVILSADGSQELTKITTQPGQTQTLEFTPPAAGIYPIDCNIAGHKEAGMVGELTVK